MTATHWQRVLGTSWWLLCPSFAALVARLTLERSCADPYFLLPNLMARPTVAWPLAMLYLLGHVWTLAAYLSPLGERPETTRTRGIPLAWPRSHALKVWLMTGLLLVEYAPITLWRMIGRLSGCAL
jgi:hypothetical protein